MYMIIYL